MPIVVNDIVYRKAPYRVIATSTPEEGKPAQLSLIPVEQEHYINCTDADVEKPEPAPTPDAATPPTA